MNKLECQSNSNKWSIYDLGSSLNLVPLLQYSHGVFSWEDYFNDTDA